MYAERISYEELQIKERTSDGSVVRSGNVLLVYMSWELHSDFCCGKILVQRTLNNNLRKKLQKSNVMPADAFNRSVKGAQYQKW